MCFLNFLASSVAEIPLKEMSIPLYGAEKQQNAAKFNASQCNNKITKTVLVFKQNVIINVLNSICLLVKLKHL